MVLPENSVLQKDMLDLDKSLKPNFELEEL
jgi:hypothetical protein